MKGRRRFGALFAESFSTRPQIVGLTIYPSFRVFSSLDDVQAYLQEPVAI